MSEDEIEKLMNLADDCDREAITWLCVATRGNPNFVDPKTCDALDTALAWQARADIARRYGMLELTQEVS